MGDVLEADEGAIHSTLVAISLLADTTRFSAWWRSTQQRLKAAAFVQLIDEAVPFTTAAS
ncbi:hypothetical protein [Bradyrhizobium sp. CCBAU 51745]|uniref:hypothetical protein n=1 Tax=Bradyrhizobium sp. CCBAU 51745 TaxID=1325099 RepID=UPI00230531A5|nr:hypothetical protein [Bradyrhizobium sp. CCBAU 51745]